MDHSLAPVPSGTPLSTAGSSPAFYRPELDALRFFAFLAVFVTHACAYSTEFLLAHHLPGAIANSLPKIIRAGAYGVDLFFALSAYLITELLLREKAKRGTLDVKAFYIRRILRIWPLYYCVLAVALIPVLNPDREFSAHHFAMFALLSGNWSLTLSGWHAGPVVFPLWSISVEEQFYLLWPPIVAKLNRRSMAVTALVLIFIANLDRLWQFIQGARPLEFWGDTFAHLDSIAIGILVSVLLQGRSLNISFAHRVAMIGSGVACFVLAGWFVAPTPEQPPIALGMLGAYAIVAVGCLAVLVGFIGLDLRYRWLVYLGKISFGLYAYHALCIFLVGQIRPLDHFGIREPAILALTVAMAAVSYKLLEKPFLRLKERFAHVRSRPA